MDDLFISYCNCMFVCCPLDGCCSESRLRTGPTTSGPPRQRPVVIQKTHAARATPGMSFIDLPAELKNRIYELVLRFEAVIDITIDEARPRTVAPCPWAIMATCREVYYETVPLYYGANTFRIFRGYPRDFTIPRSLDLPFHLVQDLILVYPRSMGVGSHTFLSHAWSHFVRDSHQITSKFRHLNNLQLSLEYHEKYHLQSRKIESWAAILERPAGISDEEQARRVRGVVLGLNALEGRRMPACVSFLIEPSRWEMFHAPSIREDHDLERLNDGLRLAASSR